MQFVVGYPRSGNTWIRLTAAAYAFEELEPTELVQMDDGNQELTRQLWDDANTHHFQAATPFALSNVDFSAEVRIRPSAMMVLTRDISRAPVPKLALVDSHHANCSVNGINLWNPEWTSRVVNLIRDPREICCSLSAYLGTSYDDTAAFMADQKASFPPENHFSGEEDDDEDEQDDAHLHHLLLSWSNHVRSWFDSDGLEVLSVRYEDLHEDPVRAFRRIFEFLGVDDLDEPRLKKAVEKTSFDTLREAEEEVEFPKATEHQEYFFRSGKPEGWKDELPTEVAEKIEADHGEMMGALGYL